MIEAIRSFLAVAIGPEPPAVDALCRALDGLALAYHATPEGEPDSDDWKPPEPDAAAPTQIASRYPELGFYAVADPLDMTSGAIVGDAIDDIADIAKDLSGVLWRQENVSLEDACWYFRFQYEVHWGRHLHELRAYLHAVQFYSERD